MNLKSITLLSFCLCLCFPLVLSAEEVTMTFSEDFNQHNLRFGQQHLIGEAYDVLRMVDLDQTVTMGALMDKGLDLGPEFQLSGGLLTESVGRQQDDVAHQQPQLAVQPVDATQGDGHLFALTVAQQVSLQGLEGGSRQG